MSKKILIATAVGSAFVASMAAAPVASAAENPFALSALSNGYQVADASSTKPMEGKCGSAKAKAEAEAKAMAEAKAKGAKPMEGKCGANKK